MHLANVEHDTMTPVLKVDRSEARARLDLNRLYTRAEL